MAKLKIYQNAQIEKLLSRRPGETKFGEKVSFTKTLEDLPQSKATYVLFGISEDVGVRANHGNPGASKAWSSFLPAFLNIQSNEFNRPEDLLLLGEVDCSEEMLKASHLEESDPNYLLKLGELVSRIDEAVSAVVKEIVSAGKIPIIIGGGHNNAYGNLKGASEALGSAVSVLNIDAHTDLRQLEQRHSGNGFSYARKNGYLKRYAVFGLQQNYTPQFIFEEMRSTEEIKFTLMEELSA